MANSYFRFKQFTIHQSQSAMKVTTDACLFGAWTAVQLKGTEINRKLLDIGTGTGLLSLMISQAFPDLYIDAVELDISSAAEAGKNIEDAGKAESIRVTETDFLHYQSAYPYDFIISNPPFYENEIRSTDNRKNMAHHDESLRLVNLLPQMKNVLKPEGQFFLLLPYKRMAAFLQLAETLKMQVSLTTVYPKEGNAAFRLLIKGRFAAAFSHTMETALTIKNEADQYTPEFISLLKPYYLFL